MGKAWAAIQKAFSAPSLAALRNVLSAASVFIGALGIAGLTQAKLQTLVDAIMSLGTATAALIAAVSVLVAAAMPIIAGFKSTFAAQRASVAAQPHTLVVPTASADEAVKTATALAAMPGVLQVIASQRVADAAPSNKVVAK